MTGRRVAAGMALAFGLLTVVSGGSALLGAINMGAVVPFVLWFNFLAGAAYIVGGLLLWRGHPWAFPVAVAILLATAVVFAAFLWRVAAGAAYESRTVWAMTLRTAFWTAMAGLAWRSRGGGAKGPR